MKYEARLRLRNLATGKAAVRQRIKDCTGLESFEAVMVPITRSTV